jgi:hypothetical protein
MVKIGNNETISFDNGTCIVLSAVKLKELGVEL